MSTTPLQPLVSDAAERRRALDPRESFLVQAPAGSGKTELLVLRFLALLPHVDEPEQILAITFTRKATAEMRIRVLRALQAAKENENLSANEHEQEVRKLAKAALSHSETRGWQLTEQPQRLNIQTIDSLALSIASQMPLLSRLGGRLTPIDDARPLYALAAEHTMAQLGSAAQPELAQALSDLLKLRDTSLADCEALIAGMLAKRDQWLLVLPGIVQHNPDWEDLKARLEEPFHREHERAVQSLQNELGRTPGVLEDLLALAHIAYTNGQEQLAGLSDLRSEAELTNIAHWQCLCHLLLKKDGQWRSRIAGPEGFPPHSREHATRLKSIVQRLSANDVLLRELRNIRDIPPAAYSPEEWHTVRSIFIVLRHAIGQLRVVFAEQDVIDFAEAGIAAHAALETPNVLMRLDERVRHLLVDEFQDTSRPHFALLRLLLDDWQAGDGRTCFLVGDPMQSIYLFRDAESRLFSQVRERGIERAGSALPFTALRLSTNFRSLSAIVNPLNDLFERVLIDDAEDDVVYAASVSSRGNAHQSADALHLHVQTRDRDTQSRDGLNAAEADAMIAIIRKHEDAMERARHDGARYRVAVLARARPHLAAIIARLQQEKIPFRGVNIDLLQDRQEILDLLSLLRALLHPADRVAWLAVLRAPWCGLTISALHAICGDAESAEQDLTIPALIHKRQDRLDTESRRRALYVLSVLEQAQAAYAAGELASSPAGLTLWLERTWHALGAPRYLDAESFPNCEAFFAALAQMPPSCFGTLDESLKQRLQELYAQPNPAVSEDCGVQLMTIHQAKGLEFEVVLVPQLQRPGKSDDPALFHWLIQRRPGSKNEELLLAPIGYKHSDNPRLYDWVGKKSSRRFQQEEKRLLYVACSRAICELHLFATIDRKQNGELARPKKGTLLAAGWPGMEQRIQEATPRPLSNLVTISHSSSGASGNGVVTAIAAATDASRQTLRRLPIESFPNVVTQPGEAPARASVVDHIHEDIGIAGRLQRIQGIVLHALLERASAGTSGTRPDWVRLSDALLRQHGLTSAEAATARKAVLQGIQNALAHEQGLWLLMPRDFASGGSWTESSWNMTKGERVLGQRPDRVFLGGASPGAPGTEYLWIVDYKTAALPEGIPRDTFLAASREQYHEQLETYSELFRHLRDVDEKAATREHRLAIYHPMLPWLDWWPA